MAKHKHAEAIIAWANGERVLYRLSEQSAWQVVECPSWDRRIEYMVSKTATQTAHLNPHQIGASLSFSEIVPHNIVIKYDANNFELLEVSLLK